MSFISRILNLWIQTSVNKITETKMWCYQFSVNCFDLIYYFTSTIKIKRNYMKVRIFEYVVLKGLCKNEIVLIVQITIKFISHFEKNKYNKRTSNVKIWIYKKKFCLKICSFLQATVALLQQNVEIWYRKRNAIDERAKRYWREFDRLITSNDEDM